MTNKRTLAPLALAGFLAAGLTFAGLASSGDALAADERNVVPGRTAAGAPLGLHGADPVALVAGGKREQGSAANAATHDGVAYYFASAENKVAFEKDPARYAPENGGFCTYGVSIGKKFDGSPSHAAVEDGKLYVFLNEEIFQAFAKDRAGTIAKAEAHWKKIEHTAATDL